MPAYQLVIAPAAKLDLSDIYQYGLRRWGKARSEMYLTIIKDQFWALIDQPLIGVERPELLAGIRSLPIQSHTLFYRVASNRIDIIRILHGRQDPQRHLK
ncbi:MAG: type II toxin-antitoxin system RelE/ParE family toxin [Pseudomonadales bacterium]|nr:type II toxin-antitoxin system RelE/ParE family toxin [Pseudomonadales bacterium]